MVAGVTDWQQASTTASHVFCDCVALATLRFKHLGQHCMTPGDLKDISISRILHFVQGVGQHKKLTLVKVHGSLQCPPTGNLFYSIKWTASTQNKLHMFTLFKTITAFRTTAFCFQKILAKISVSFSPLCMPFISHSCSLLNFSPTQKFSKTHTSFFTSSCNCSLWHSLTDTHLPIHQGKQILCCQSSCNFNWYSQQNANVSIKRSSMQNNKT
jgi:hypothetical protein